MKYNININQKAAINSGLDLDIIDLAIFDFIKDFATCSKCVKVHTPEGQYFWISHKMVLTEMPLLTIKTNQGLIKRVENLVREGVLQKHPQCEVYNRTLYTFGPNSEALLFECSEVDTPKQKFKGGLNKSLGGGLNKSLGYHNNNIDNNIKDNISAQNEFVAPSLFPENTEPKIVEEKKIERKTLFRNSEIFSLVKFDSNGLGDYSGFENLFSSTDFKDFDLAYYFNVVNDWSDQKNMKRTKRGWLATVRTFIRGDVERGKAKKKNMQAKGFDVSGALDYLNEQ